MRAKVIGRPPASRWPGVTRRAAGTGRISERLGQRWLLLSQLRVLPAWMLAATIVLLLVRAVLPAATAITAGVLIGRLVTGAHQAGAGAGTAVAVGWFVAVLMASPLMELLAEPLRFVVGRRIDGAHRRAVERLACAPAGIAHLEDPQSQGDLALAAGDPDNWTEGMPGPAAWSQLVLAFRYAGGLLLAALVARDSLALAAFVLVSLVIFGSVQGWGFLRVVRTWVTGMAYRRRATYWAGLLTGAPAAKELRVFGFWAWAQRRYLRETRAHLEPFRNAKLADVRGQWRWLCLALAAVGVTVYTLGAMAASGHIPVGRLGADLTAVALLVRTFATSEDLLAVEAGLPRLLALHRLSAQLGIPATQAPAPQVTAAQATVTGPAQAASTAAPAAAPPLVRFEGVRFHYPGSERMVLDGLDLEIQPGEVVALAGLNGAGKTTIIKLLAGLYQPTAGRISVNGTDLREMDPGQWRRSLAVVFQDFLRYPLPVRDNIKLGSPGAATEANLRAAAGRSGVTAVIDGLPGGWDTWLTPGRDGSVDLSGGQWQRVALARAMFAVVTGARLLVLDEPTAHLDVRTEFEVFDQVITAAKEQSVVLISHRLSTVRTADRIVMIENGAVTESGSHSALLDRGGRYAELFELQASQFTGTAAGNGAASNGSGS